MNTRLLRAHRENPRGQALVETALVIPLILLLALATFDLGRAFAANIALTEAAQEGALAAGYRFFDPDDPWFEDQAPFEALVQSSSTAEAVVAAEVTVDPACDEEVEVEATTDVPVVTPLATLVFGSTFNLYVEVHATNIKFEDC